MWNGKGSFSFYKMDTLLYSALTLLRAVCVLTLSNTKVSTAEVSRFVLKEKPLHLDVQQYEKLPPWDRFQWYFERNSNQKTIVDYSTNATPKVYGDYKTRAKFDQKNLSLQLKNMQEGDSGFYTAKIIDHEGQHTLVAAYRVSVQEATPKPQVSLKLLYSGGEYCNVSVNCSAKDTWASFTCDQSHCTQGNHSASLTGISIFVTATNGSIHCNSSNRVSTETKSKSLVCVKGEQEKTPMEISPIYYALSIIIIIIIIIIIVGPIVYYKKFRHSGGSQTTQCNTEYASVEFQENGSAMKSMSTYATVNVGPAGTPPDTVYATVNKRS
ncbi:hypothetical protein AAFF_G00218590 [Aldrovandia affinis]|uniref:Immunoglobulin V-set domain-containing protein n=1 Tax=Aldrovandia affinis TaxID=143900 RepID=A0AAD7WUU1_9TELE|nr:hypothetical protein AAFF_G00218590 [Aldrovandia affinis]